MGIEIAILAGLSSAYAASASARAADANASKAAQNLGSTHEDPILKKRREATPIAPGKCPCCGSHQFVTHLARRICSYCRSEQ